MAVEEIGSNLPVNQVFASGLNPFATIGKRIQAFDEVKLIPDKDEELSLAEKWITGCTKRAARDLAGHVLDNRIVFPSVANPIFKVAARKLTPLTSQSLDYRDLFNIDHLKYNIGKEHHFKSYREALLNRSNHRHIGNLVRENYRGFIFKPSISLEDFLKKTVVADNIGSLIDPIKDGRYFTSIARIGSLALAVVPIISSTSKAYKESSRQEDGLLIRKIETIAKTGATLITQSLKALICWEIGSIGYMFAMSLLPVGIAGMVAGVLGMGLASAISYKVLSAIIPDHF